MSEFVWRFARRAEGNDLLTLLGDTDVSLDGRPTDIAAWHDWLASLDWVRTGHQPQTGVDSADEWWAEERREFELVTSVHRVPSELLTASEAFLAMTEYLWRVANRRAANELEDVLAELSGDESFDANSPSGIEWLLCVAWIRDRHPAQSGPAG